MYDFGASEVPIIQLRALDGSGTWSRSGENAVKRRIGDFIGEESSLLQQTVSCKESIQRVETMIAFFLLNSHVILTKFRKETMTSVLAFVTHPLYESRMHWIPDPTPSPPRRTGMVYSDPLVKSSDPLSQFQVILCVPVMPPWNLIILVIPRRPPLLRASHQELLSPRLSQKNAGEGGGERLAEQPMKIQRLTQLPRWPWMSAGPIIMRGFRERPSISQRPVTPPRWSGPQCTQAQTSTLIPSHSLPSQRPIEIRHFL